MFTYYQQCQHHKTPIEKVMSIKTREEIVHVESLRQGQKKAGISTENACRRRAFDPFKNINGVSLSDKNGSKKCVMHKRKEERRKKKSEIKSGVIKSLFG